MSNAHLITLWDGLLYGDELDEAFVQAIEAEVGRRSLDGNPEQATEEVVANEVSPGELTQLIEQHTPVRGLRLVSGRLTESGRGIRGRCICSCGRKADLSVCFDVGGAWIYCPVCGMVAP